MSSDSYVRTTVVLPVAVLYLSDCMSFQVRQNNTGNILRDNHTSDHVCKYCTYISCSITSQKLALFPFSAFRVRTTRLIMFIFLVVVRSNDSFSIAPPPLLDDDNKPHNNTPGHSMRMAVEKR